MRRQDTVRLDTHRLVARFEAADLKQWWLAEQIGVHRKTVSRWLSGKVTRIDRDNLDALATELDCTASELVAPGAGNIYATRAERAAAVSLVRERELVELLSPSDDWALGERLLKAIMQPDLPLADLGRLYNLLSIVAWRQQRYGEARDHAQRALMIGDRSDDLSIQGKAWANLGTITWFEEDYARARGELLRALALDFDTVRDRASAMYNLGFLLRSCAEFGDSLDLQRRAVALYETEQRDFNLGIAWLGLAMTWIDLGRWESALDAVERGRHHAGRCRWGRGELQAVVYGAEAQVLSGRAVDLGASLEVVETLSSRGGFHHDVVESAARIARLSGELAKGWELLEKVGWPARSFGAGTALQERARLERAGGGAGAESWSKANQVFSKLRLERRIDLGPVREVGVLFSGIAERL